jgi:dTDP-4-dehydrorhamnose 3,5-epimerase
MGFQKSIKQINHSVTSKKGSIRGLHYQIPPYSEIKIVNCIKGEIYDVAIDLRPDSSTFLKWHAEVLSDKNMCSLLIPEGFAHGFQTLTNDCEIIYVHSEAYSPSHERGIRFDDPMIKVHWPLPIYDCSERDRSHSLLNINTLGIKLK